MFDDRVVRSWLRHPVALRPKRSLAKCDLHCLTLRCCLAAVCDSSSRHGLTQRLSRSILSGPGRVMDGLYRRRCLHTHYYTGDLHVPRKMKPSEVIRFCGHAVTIESVAPSSCVPRLYAASRHFSTIKFCSVSRSLTVALFVRSAEVGRPCDSRAPERCTPVQFVASALATSVSCVSVRPLSSSSFALGGRVGAKDRALGHELS